MHLLACPTGRATIKGKEAGNAGEGRWGNLSSRVMSLVQNYNAFGVNACSQPQ